MAGDHGEGMAETVGRPPSGLDHALASERQQVLRVTVVHDRRMRSHARLERKADKQRLAEGMDGLDIETAGRIQHASKELARHAALIVGRLAAEQVEELRL